MSRWRVLLLVLVLELAAVAVIARAALRGPATVEEAVAAFMRTEGIPGAVVAFGRAGGSPTVIARGQTRGGVPVEPRHRFWIASLSKPVTAAAIFDLVERGALTLESPLAAHFPEVEAAPDLRHRDITVRHLLQHTAGWDRRQTFDPIADAEAARRELGVADAADCRPIATAMLLHPLQFSPGERYAYSNLGYCWLGLLVERVSGKPYESFVREVVLAPAGAGSMRIGEEGLGSGELVHQAHHSIWPAVQPPAVLGAAGGWTATAEEYFRVASRPVPASVSEAPLPISATRAAGLGWRVWRDREGVTLGHFGALPGTFTLALRTGDGHVIVALFTGRPRDDDAAFDRLRETLPALARAVPGA